MNWIYISQMIQCSQFFIQVFQSNIKKLTKENMYL